VTADDISKNTDTKNNYVKLVASRIDVSYMDGAGTTNMKSIIIMLGLLCGSCGTTQKMKYSSNAIIGRWCSISNTADYPHLTLKPIIKNKILKLTQDSLVMETLLEHQTEQEYYPCDK